MFALAIGSAGEWVHSEGIATFDQVQTMDAKDFDELAGRIDAIGQAVLRLAAELEMQGVIDGTRVSAAWVSVAEHRTEATAAHRSAHKTLRQMAQMLDDARHSRLLRWLPD